MKNILLFFNKIRDICLDSNRWEIAMSRDDEMTKRFGHDNGQDNDECGATALLAARAIGGSLRSGNPIRHELHEPFSPTNVNMSQISTENWLLCKSRKPNGCEYPLFS